MKQNNWMEPAAEQLREAAGAEPGVEAMTHGEARERLERMQEEPVCLYPAETEETAVLTKRWGRVPVTVVKPACVGSPADAIVYLHGGGWVTGSFHTHEKLVRELAARTGCVVIFPSYSRAPEARFPIALEQCYSVLCTAGELMAQAGYTLNPDTLTVAGDSAGGNLAIAVTLKAKYSRGPKIQKQLLFYPVTNPCFDTESYQRFGKDFYLTRDGMKWFWNQYAPSPRERNGILVSPMRADSSQLRGLPEALVVTGEADVLRDEGEAYAARLRSAGVPVTAARFQGILHDFVMLHALDATNACRGAMDLAVEWIYRKNTEVAGGKTG